MKPGSAATRSAASERAREADDHAAALDVLDARAAAGPLEYSVVTTRAAFEALSGEWDALFERAGSGAQVFQTFGWCRHWCNHYLDDRSDKQSLAIVTGRRGGRLVLVWPLVRERSTGMVKLVALGAPTSQYSDAIVETSPEATKHLREAWNAVVAEIKPDFARLLRVREDSVLAPLMQELSAVAVQRLEAPYIDLSNTPDIDAYMARRSAQARKRQRAADRRIAKLEPKIVELSQSDEAADLAGSVIDMKRRQLAERGLLSPAFGDDGLRAFFADAARAGPHATGVSVVTLEIGQELAAANIMIGCRDRIVGHVFTYDSKFAKDSVGAHVVHHTIKQAIADGYKTFDLLSPADEYKMRSADGTVGVVNWAIPLSPKGRAFVHIVLRTARPLAKALIERLPSRLRTALAQRYYRKTS